MNPTFRRAVLLGALEAVRLHIDRGDELQAIDEQGNTLLLLAARRNHQAVCRLLLEAGANPAACNSQGLDAIGVATAAGAEAAADVLKSFVSRMGELAADPSPVIRHMISEPILDWEPEATPSPPQHDERVALAALAAQARIFDHVVIDNDAAWEDFEIDLPFAAARLARARDEEQQQLLTAVLLLALREGQAPELLLEAVAAFEMPEDCNEFLGALHRTVNDLGAEIEEAEPAYAGLSDSHLRGVSAPSAEELEKIDEAREFLDALGEDRSPLRFFQRDARNYPLLTAREEIELAQAMEAARSRAIEALASWPQGLSILKAALDQAVLGKRAARTILQPIAEDDAPPGDMDATEQPQEALGAEAFDESHETTEEAAPSRFDLAGAAEELALLGNPLAGSASWRRLLEFLEGLRLRPPFLMQIADAHRGDPTSPRTFVEATDTLRRARDRMTLCNLRLVLSNARGFWRGSFPLDDLLQEGHVGLLTAVDRFDWRKGFRFSTYATWWVKQAMSRGFADSGRLIRLPVHVHDNANRIERARRDVEAQRGRPPTEAEIAACVSLPEAKVRSLLRARQDPISLDAMLEDEVLPMDLALELVMPDPMAAFDTQDLARAIDRLLVGIDKKQARIVQARFGLENSKEHTLEELGQALGLTRERVRQIESKALSKIQHPSRIGILRPWATPKKTESNESMGAESFEAVAPGKEDTEKRVASKIAALGGVPPDMQGLGAHPA